ncbi:hypothetical protein BJY04DRAFT_202674 [Aspergillus karnatakaensis]|uniref:uncharacterized protein n=1 Tax=Aspergillus karnatakaensis TaxID=1810916 RepID=UPI003CCCB722
MIFIGLCTLFLILVIATFLADSGGSKAAAYRDVCSLSCVEKLEPLKNDEVCAILRTCLGASWKVC